MNKALVALCAVGVLTGCSSNPLSDNDPGIMERPPEVVDTPPEQTTVEVGNRTVPVWFLELPEDSETRIYGVGTGLSDDMQFAFEKAIHSAKVNLADKIAAKSSSELKAFVSDNGKGGQGVTTRKTTKVSKSGFADIDVSRYVIEHRAVNEERRYFRAYVQLSLDPNDRYHGEVVNTYNPQDEVIADKAMDDL
jgi:hypothetical protein